MRHYQRGIATTIILSLFLIVGVAIASSYFIFSQNKQKTESVNSFESCAKLYPVMESYPEQCNTPDGKHFVRQLSEEEKKKLVPPTEPLSVSNTNAGWTAFTGSKTDSKSGPTLEYPQGWKVEENYNSEEESLKTIFRITPQNEEDQKNYYSISLRYLENPKLIPLKDYAKNTNINDQNCQIYSSSDKQIIALDNKTVFYRPNGFCEPLEATFYTWEDDDRIYQLIGTRMGVDTEVKDDSVLSKIFQSIKFNN